MHDPSVSEPVRKRTKGAMSRYFRRNRARQLALRDLWMSTLPSTDCAHPNTRIITDATSSGHKGIVIDPVAERRCDGCYALMGFAS